MDAHLARRQIRDMDMGGVQVGDARVGGARSDGVTGRGASGKTPFLAAVRLRPTASRIASAALPTSPGKPFATGRNAISFPAASCTATAGPVSPSWPLPVTSITSPAPAPAPPPASAPDDPTFRWINTLLGISRPAC